MDEVSIAKVGCTRAAKEVRNGNFEIGKIDTTEDDADDWHNEVIDEGANDLNAPPMMTPTARSMTLPRLMKSRNSLRIGFIFLILFLSFFKSGFFMRLLYLIKYFWYSRDNLVGD